MAQFPTLHVGGSNGFMPNLLTGEILPDIGVFPPTTLTAEIPDNLMPILQVGDIDLSKLVQMPRIVSAEAEGTDFAFVASGGVKLGGTSLVADNLPFITSGGVVIGGSAIVPNQYRETATGGVVISGVAVAPEVFAHIATGGVIVSGTAVLKYNRAEVGFGGVAISGTATDGYTAYHLPTGGVVIGGEAPSSKTLAAVYIDQNRFGEFDNKYSVYSEGVLTVAHDLEVILNGLTSEGNAYNTKVLSGIAQNTETTINFVEQTVKGNATYSLSSTWQASRGAAANGIADVNIVLDSTGEAVVVRSLSGTPTITAFYANGSFARGRIAAFDTKLACRIESYGEAVRGSALSGQPSYSLGYSGILGKIVTATFNPTFGVISYGVAYNTQTLPIIRVMSINLTTGAITEYEQYPFVSYCKHDGKTYAAGDGGIYEIGGTSDNGQPINAQVKWGKMDFFSPLDKRAHDVWVGAQYNGTMTWQIYDDDGNIHEYPLNNTNIYTTNHKAHLGRGIKSRWWQFGMKSSVPFKMNDALVRLTVGERR
jgi:hypothetical protein